LIFSSFHCLELSWFLKISRVFWTGISNTLPKCAFWEFSYIQGNLTLFLSGRGHYGPGHHERPCCFRRVRATSTKIHDFVSVYVWMAPWKLFLGFVFKIFEKRKNFFLTILTSKGPPFGKKKSKISKIFFLQKNHTFSFWICIVHVLSFLLMYITLIYQKNLDFDLFLHGIFHFSPWSFDSRIGQNYNS